MCTHHELTVLSTSPVIFFPAIAPSGFRLAQCWACSETLYVSTDGRIILRIHDDYYGWSIGPGPASHIPAELPPPVSRTPLPAAFRREDWQW